MHGLVHTSSSVCSALKCESIVLLSSLSAFELVWELHEHERMSTPHILKSR